MFQPKYSVVLGNVGSCCDRYMMGGYSAPFTIEQLFDRVAEIEHVQGVELVGNWHIRAENAQQIKNNLDRTGLKLVSIIPDHFGQMKWGKGAFSSKDPAIRAEAIAHTKEMMDLGAELGGPHRQLMAGTGWLRLSFSVGLC
jgi:xylose isomerase